MTAPLKAPFPWLGGKRKVAAEVWRIWFSPACLNSAPGLFDAAAENASNGEEE